MADEYKVVADTIVSSDDDMVIKVAGDVYKGSITNNNRLATIGDVGGSAALVVPMAIKDGDDADFITFVKTGTGTARIETPQDDLSLRSARDITLYAGNDGPGNVYIGWGDAVYTPDATNKVATIGDISGTKTFDEITVQKNDGTGQNVKIGDDAWIGDVNVSNHIAITGVEDSSLGGIIFGDAKTETISTSAGNDMTISSAGDMTITSVNGNMQFFMDGGMYIGTAESDNQILKRADISNVSRVVSAPANATDTGAAGQIAVDSSYLYVCVATNTWKRVAVSTW